MPTHVFIVRPFGVKDDIDFDWVEEQIIAPVLEERPDTTWGTTGLIVEAGNVRSDMMDLLLTADLVIADISIHNANVYYELGVRHALRHRPTILIRTRADDVPFDLKTDRYLTYDPADPESGRDALRRTVEATLSSETTDSPVYNHIPGLEERDGASYIIVPPEFAEAVEAARGKSRAAELGLLGDEARAERWHLSGQRLVGQALMDLGAYRSAGAAWQRIHQERPGDKEANLKLATVHQRRGDLVESDLAVTRVLDHEPDASDRAEALALRARNLKTRWTEEWRKVDDLEERQRVALRSTHLLSCLADYRAGFLVELNKYYSGINALTVNMLLIELATRHPGVWSHRFDSNDEAEIELRKQRRQLDQLAAATNLSLEAARTIVQRQETSDPWLALSQAEFRFLTSDRVGSVAQAYRDGGDAGQFNIGSAAAQVVMFRDLDIFRDRAAAALEALGLPDGPPPPPDGGRRPRILVSSGHRVDGPDRGTPRFPDTPEAEAAVRAAIAAEIEKEKVHSDGDVIGMSGLASGNDILFQEVAAQVGIPTEALLALPQEQFLNRSVGHEGSWPERFRQLCARLSPEELTESEPAWVTGADGSYVFHRFNMWLLERAFANEKADVTLIALWNEAAGDGPGGTADMVALARQRGAKVTIIKTPELF